MEEYRIYRDIVCIDLKSFYASVECALRGLDPFKTPLIVADEERGGGSIVLAVSPYLKQKGFKNIYRLHEIPRSDDLVIAKPRMRQYLAVSRDIVRIYLDYVAREDMHVYSVDEVFLDLTPYLTYYRKDAIGLARTIMRRIYEETGIPSACGIGDNLLLSKLALDLKSKKVKSHIAVFRYGDIKEELWPVRPLSKMWGIGPRMERRLNQLNIYTVGDLAQSDIRTLKKLFGVIGEELYYHAHGIDQSIISEKGETARSTMKSVGLGQTLFRDYDANSVFTLFLEMADEVGERLRFIRKEARTIHLSIGYSKASGGGFSRQRSLEHPTDLSDDILNACLDLFWRHYEDAPIRRISIRATRLTDARLFTQLSFFEKVERREKTQSLFRTIDRIRARFGKTSVMRLTSHLDDGTAIDRADMVGGHRG